ncbi:MAG: phosphoglucosamine mutase [Bacteroidota bacterium]
MTLIKSISGIRGTIGGRPGSNLTPIDIVEFAAAYASHLLDNNKTVVVVIGRDGRLSGPHVQSLVVQTLLMMGVDVIDLGLSTTPTVELMVTHLNASGGIIITASHNPKEWNALKFLNQHGEFIDAKTGEQLLNLAQTRQFNFANVDQIGSRTSPKVNQFEHHISQLLALPTVHPSAIRKVNFTVVVDCINSTGGLLLRPLMERLGCRVILLHDADYGEFSHNPEPLEQNLDALRHAVVAHEAHLGVAVDPDVDRLAFVDEQGNYCGEEYTLVMIADWVLRHQPGSTVSNLSSTKALREITVGHGQKYHAAAVGEVNVVTKMKEVEATIGGEGNGGVIYPELHYGRDAAVGVALLLSALAYHKETLSAYRNRFPNYTIIKNKIQLTPEINVDELLSSLAALHAEQEVDTQDGVKIYFDNGWVHCRKSNTEPIIRIYAESTTSDEAHQLAYRVQIDIDEILK